MHKAIQNKAVLDCPFIADETLILLTQDKADDLLRHLLKTKQGNYTIKRSCIIKVVIKCINSVTQLYLMSLIHTVTILSML